MSRAVFLGKQVHELNDGELLAARNFVAHAMAEVGPDHYDAYVEDMGEVLAETFRRRSRRPLELVFTECDTCRALPGTPPLCRGCLRNRLVIEAYAYALKCEPEEHRLTQAALDHLNRPMTR